MLDTVKDIGMKLNSTWQQNEVEMWRRMERSDVDEKVQTGSALSSLG